MVCSFGTAWYGRESGASVGLSPFCGWLREQSVSLALYIRAVPHIAPVIIQRQQNRKINNSRLPRAGNFYYSASIFFKSSTGAKILQY